MSGKAEAAGLDTDGSASIAAAAAQLEAMGLVPSDGEQSSVEQSPAEQNFAEPDFSAKPSTRRAQYSSNLALQGLPASFEAVQHQFDSSGPSDSPRDVMSEEQVGDLLARLNESAAPRYSWSIPSHSAHRSVDADDIDDRLTTVQDTLADLETTVASVDTTATEIDTAVGSLAEDVESLKDSVREVQTEMQILTAQVASIHDALVEIGSQLRR